jgi:hypothetical protein
MSHTINFDEDFIADDELRVLETKNAILKKLRLRFSMLDESSGCKRYTSDSLNVKLRTPEVPRT